MYSKWSSTKLPSIELQREDSFHSFSSEETASLSEGERLEIERERMLAQQREERERQQSEKNDVVEGTADSSSGSQDGEDEEQERLRRLDEAARIEREWLERERQEAERQAEAV